MRGDWWRGEGWCGEVVWQAARIKAEAMAQVSKFGYFLLHSSLPKPSNIQFRSLLTVLASSSKRHRRKSTTPKPMEVKEESSSFNKRRAQGRDKNDISKKNLLLKVRKLNPINTISYVQILGTGMDTQDTSPSVLLFFDNQRFIFNAGEVTLYSDIIICLPISLLRIIIYIHLQFRDCKGFALSIRLSYQRYAISSTSILFSPNVNWISYY